MGTADAEEMEGFGASVAEVAWAVVSSASYLKKAQDVSQPLNVVKERERALQISEEILFNTLWFRHVDF